MRMAHRLLIKSSFVLGLLLAASCTSPAPNDNQTSGNANTQANQNANAPQAQRVPATPPQNSNSQPATGGNIEVASTPPGADVILVPLSEGGAEPPQQRGFTPTTIRNLPAGKYSVRLEMSGYAPFNQNVSVGTGETKKVKATLKKRQ